MWFKGNSIVEFVPDFTVIDLETTGRGMQYTQITEISAIKYRNYEPVASFSTLIRAKFPILPFVEQLTGISDTMIAGSPQIEEVIQSFVDFIDEDLIVGHNVNFDLGLVSDAYYHVTKQSIYNNYLDTLRISRILNTDSLNHKLETLCQYFGIQRDVGHRGLADCEQTGQLYVSMKEKALNNNERGERYECI
ncbi:DNA polymerase III subunit epsilon [Erysipelothrix larvae]|uniref:DNA polymerase III subunit epsilon n=1 Tax=Erysipelothrix larvae TaxID=1514105 RepID=A0A0X8GXZ4_9FIRM|nr:3'-5' exonuclease [Erysipelothrix larvae]AMC92500.1 DNA polymerase III subunit epsilon [Erysipelothrix larvae]